MTRRWAGQGLVVGSCLLAFLGAACTPSDPPPPPPSSSAPTPTPTENAQEREEREAYAAAEKSYREFRAEFNRVLITGGAEKATAHMAELAGGAYLKDNVEVVQAYLGLSYHQEGTDRIAYVHEMGYSPGSVLLSSCEDATQVKAVGERGQLIGRGDTRTLELEVRRTGSQWKVWKGTGRQVKSCDGS